MSGLNKWLYSITLVIKSLKVSPDKFDEKKAEFITYYKQLKSTLLPDEGLLFMDAVHPTQPR